MYIAHIRASDGELQPLHEHLIETKMLAEKEGGKFKIAHLAGLTACFHDFGKYSNEFQT